MMNHYFRFLISCIFLWLIPAITNAHTNIESIDISSTEIKPNLYVLMAHGGSNMALLVDEKGSLLIDNHLEKIGKNLEQAISEITASPVKYLVNTHWHFDHAGNNSRFGEKGTVIVAHQAARSRLENGQLIKALGLEIPPAPSEALPEITFNQELTLHWAGETLYVQHVGAAHTDGDAVIFFKKANVVHMGDLYFTNMYPFIDASSGGSLSGVIRALDLVLNQIDDKTIVIPGHGAISNKAEMLNYRNMLTAVADRISFMKLKGKSLNEVIAEKPTSEYDSQYGEIYLSPNDWLRIIYDAL